MNRFISRVDFEREYGRDYAKPLATNRHLLRWIEKMRDLVKPAAVHWVDGSQQEYDDLKRAIAAYKRLATR
jgi:GTP-dependent phosphoenolpyruvate carboxykinase